MVGSTASLDGFGFAADEKRSCCEQGDLKKGRERGGVDWET